MAARARIRGAPELKRRLSALRKTVQISNRRWGTATAQAARPMTPVLTGRLRKSYRVLASQKRARVNADYTAYFVDAGPKQHGETPKHARMLAFQANGRTVFARKVNHPGYGARPYRVRAAIAGLEHADPTTTIIQLWNGAA